MYVCSKAFSKLEKWVWLGRDISVNSKISVHQSCVLAALLYSSETLTKKNLRKLSSEILEAYLKTSGGSLLNLSCSAMGQNTQHRETAHNQLPWAGHLRRMEDQILPRHLFYGEFTFGNYQKHKPKTTRMLVNTSLKYLKFMSKTGKKRQRKGMV